MLLQQTSVVEAPTTSSMEPISRTYQYRKVMKPMLERKRRARINRCLDDLKELMVTALQSEGENVSKLEKADILELTVRHLHKLRRQQRLAANPVIDADRFRAGYTHCANEVSRCLAAIPHVDVQLGTKLMTHLGLRLNEMDKVAPLVIQVPVPPTSPSSRCSSNSSPPPTYTLPLTPASSEHSTNSNSTTTAAPITSSAMPSPPPAHMTTGLLKVANSNPMPMMWRPW